MRLPKKKIILLFLLALFFSQCATHDQWIEGRITALDREKREMTILQNIEAMGSRHPEEPMAVWVSSEASYEGIENFEALTLGSRVLFHYRQNPETEKWEAVEIVKRNLS